MDDAPMESIERGRVDGKGSERNQSENQEFQKTRRVGFQNTQKIIL
jgi:hypothetical protein